MNIKIIATFPIRDLELYGLTFIKGLSVEIDRVNTSFDMSITADVWLEGIDDISMNKISSHGLSNHVSIMDYDSDLVKRNEFVQHVEVEDQSELGFSGNVSRQIIKWSYKGLMQLHYLQDSTDYDYLIYLDSDIKFLKRLDKYFFDKVLPSSNQICSAVFRRDINKYTETGFIIWNCVHPKFNEWVNMYHRGWYNHEYKFLNEHHDCAIFDWVCSSFSEYQFNNLSGGGDHGFESGVLGLYFDHKKGVRKYLGFSFERINILNNFFGRFIYRVFYRFILFFK